MSHHGTALKCSCHGRETLAYGKPDQGRLEVQDRRHGQTHILPLTLPDIVKMLDPRGTSYVPVGSAH